jgi:hypothetical protein
VSGQPWADDAFAGVMIVTACYCLGRLAVSWRLRRPADHVLDATHVLMGAAMAAMLLSRLGGSWLDVLQAVFGVAALWFGGVAVRQRQAHQLQHALAAAAMTYMLGAGRSAGGPAGRGLMGAMPGPAALALVLTLALVGYVIWTADQLAGLPRVAALAAVAVAAPAGGTMLASDAAAVGSHERQAGRPGERQVGQRQAGQLAATRRAAPMSPRLAACCDLVMGVTMGYMLVLMH